MLFFRWYFLKDPDLRRQFENIPDTPEGAKLSRFYMRWVDHEVLRQLWGNLYQIAPGVWRGNQPTLKRWHWLKEQGIRSVINFRGKSTKPHYRIEQETCAKLGMEVINVGGLGARVAPSKSCCYR